MDKIGRYSEALDAQLELLGFWGSKAGEDFFHEYNKRIREARGLKIFIDDFRPLLTAAIVPLLQGETFYWSPPICQLIFTAAKSIPETWRLTDEGLDTLCGFAWLATPFYFEGAVRPVRAIAWAPAIDEKGKLSTLLPPYEQRPILTDSNRHRLAITYFSQTDICPVPFPYTIAFFPVNRDLKEARQSKDILSMEPPPTVWDKNRLFATMLAFLQQRILVPSRYVADRAARRRLEKAKQKPLSDEIKVVALRQVMYTGKGEHRDVEWTCRWIVGGHWRNQWYPSKQHYRPKYIASYLKGPEDKPLRHPERLFAVVR